MKFGSLFAGIGGIDLGLERAGMVCKWQVEIDDYCQKVLAKHWPDVERFNDVREVGKHNLKAVDLIAGGFPCQPHSVTGKRKGAEDDRNLWPEFIRIIRTLKPRYVLGENVPGIISTYLDTVLSDLEGEGYTCATFNLPACAFDAPHRRERIFIVAYTTNSNAGGNNQGARERTRLDLEGNLLDQGGRNKGKHISDARDSHVSYSPPMLRTTIKRNEQDRILSDVQNTKSKGLERNVSEILEREGEGRQNANITGSNWWSIEPDVGRVAHGVPSRVDRLRGLGNAVVPQVAKWIGRRIVEYDFQTHERTALHAQG